MIPSEKQCKACLQMKPIDDFRSFTSTVNGRRYKESYCKPCDNKIKYNRRLKNHPCVPMLNQAKKRANKNNLLFDITLDFLESIAPEKCPVFNIPLDYSYGNKKHVQPNSPSLDRIDPAKGYTTDNVWIISNRANTIKSNAYPSELRKVADKVEQMLRKTC